MADNNYQSNHGQAPFRRYEPGNPGAPNGQVLPLTPPPLTAPGGGTMPPSRSARRRQRHARNRWRQWIQSSRAATTPPTARSPRQRSGSDASSQNAPKRIKTPMPPQSRPAASRPGQPPQMANAYAPSPADSRPARPADTAPRPQSRPGNDSATRNKVTPIQRSASRSRPQSPAPNAKTRRPPPRRSGRKTPQPVLYGIRLLILGTGIAAIVGTVLSSLNSSDQTARTSGDRPVAAETAARSDNRDALTQPLPLADELVSLETDLVALETMTPGLTQSVFFYDLDSGNYIELNGTEPIAAASTIKMPILVAFLQAVDAGTVRLDEAVTLREDLMAGGSGDFQTQEIGSQFTALEAATAMIVNSDNTATNMIIELMGGTQVLNQQFNSWGLSSTMLRNMLPDLDGTNTTSSADLVRVMALVEQGDLLSRRSRDRLLGIMQRTVNRDLIPDGLADDTALTFNKTGDIGTLLGDVALVDTVNGHRYLLSVLVDRPFNDGRASELVRRVAGRIHEEMSQPVSPVGGGFPEEPSPAAPAHYGHPGRALVCACTRTDDFHRARDLCGTGHPPI
jgi:beta-lactamase class A